MKILNLCIWRQALGRHNADCFLPLLGLTCWLALGLGASSEVANAATIAPTSAQTESSKLNRRSPAQSNVAPGAIAARFDRSDSLRDRPSSSEQTAFAESLPLSAIVPTAAVKRPAKGTASVMPEATARHSQATIDEEMAGAAHDRAIAQAAENAPTAEDDLAPTESTDAEPSTDLPEPIAAYQPQFQFQAASIFQDDALSGRLRTTALYAVSDQVLFGATVDLVGGDAFVDSADEGLSLNELYVSAAPFRELPNLRLVGGLIDLTSYFDRNSFAKDVVTHFFHPVFQTNPALSASGLGSRPGLLVNWSATDQLEFKAAAFSSDRDLGDWALDGFAAEAGFRTGNLILRGTVATARDAGDDNGFAEIFQIQRSNGRFGPLDDDREVAYGVNAEYFIDSINVGLFGRYGWYENQDVERGGSTFSLGANVLDVFLAGDRLGLGYGQQLSNGDLRSGKTPDVWEVFYDAPVHSNFRVGVSLQSREEFSDTGLGLRVRADW